MTARAPLLLAVCLAAVAGRAAADEAAPAEDAGVLRAAEADALDTDAGVPADAPVAAAPATPLPGVTAAADEAPDAGIAPPEPGKTFFARVPRQGASSSDPEVPWRNMLVPVVEVPLINVSLSTFNYVVFRDEWTHVSPATIGRNLLGGWRFDIDDFSINNVGHPYQGSLYFTASRSAGYGFWGSLLAAFIGSLWWEIAGENEPPSLNDQITTPFAGAFLGEALHRTSLVLLRSPGTAPSWLRVLSALFLDPVGSLNRVLFDGRYDARDFIDETPLLGRLAVGMNALGRVSTSLGTSDTSLLLGDELHFAGGLRAGFPGHRGYAPRVPFDHFDVRAEVSISARPSASLFVHGLLWGRQVTFGETGVGTWGWFASYDFANPSVLRTATVATGLGGTLAVTVNPELQVQALLVASGVGWGAAGALYLPTTGARDYHIGPGGQVFGEVQLVNPTAGSVRLGLRQYFITGAYGDAGLERITYANAGASVAMGPRFELSADVVYSSRLAQHFGTIDDARQSATLVRIGLVVLTDLGHGVTRPKAMVLSPLP